VHEFQEVGGSSAEKKSKGSFHGSTAVAEAPTTPGHMSWTIDGEAELNKIPFFVRGKVRRNTEKFARERGLNSINSETLYEAKAFYSR
jgi:light-independent protochlorophyllide reductase subunit B